MIHFCFREQLRFRLLLKLSLLTILLACDGIGAASVPVYNHNFTDIGSTGHYQLKENIFLNSSERSPWKPFPSFNGTIETNNRLIYGFKLNETEQSVCSGLFRVVENSVIGPLIFVEPEIHNYGNNSHIGLLAGKLNFSKAAVGWLGGQVINRSSFTHLAVAGLAENSHITVLAYRGSQTMEGYNSFAAIGVGIAHSSTVLVEVLNWLQTATGNFSSIGIGIADGGSGQPFNLENENNQVRVVAQGIKQTVTGQDCFVGYLTGLVNGGKVQGVVHQINQRITGGGFFGGMSSANDSPTAQIIARDIVQTLDSAGYCPNGIVCAQMGGGIGVDYYGTNQVVIRDLRQILEKGTKLDRDAWVGPVSGGHRNNIQAVVVEPFIGPNRNLSTNVTLLSLTEALRRSLTELGLTKKQHDWTAGNHQQLPMILGLGRWLSGYATSVT